MGFERIERADPRLRQVFITGDFSSVMMIVKQKRRTIITSRYTHMSHETLRQKLMISPAMDTGSPTIADDRLVEEPLALGVGLPEKPCPAADDRDRMDERDDIQEPN
ncbi:homolog of histone chaperone HIRA [Striga asiatica]|uniref:Homolog of histone chaperone HIRA n=1 Tax=Striga asiatica TaxID=4170 RepID=A0A5A7P5D4_STRAF|nr:homolog of histone chaperone HIRA [Striga asiatica]